MDHPVIVYQPVRSAEFDDTLANLVSTPAQSADELITMVNSILAGVAPAGPAPDIRAQVEDHFGPLNGVLASERMAAIIARDGKCWFGEAPSMFDRARGYLGAIGRGAVKNVNANRPGHKNSRAYNEHRFPGLSEAEVGERLERLSKVLDRFQRLNVRQVRDNIFCLSGVSSG